MARHPAGAAYESGRRGALSWLPPALAGAPSPGGATHISPGEPDCLLEKYWTLSGCFLKESLPHRPPISGGLEVGAAAVGAQPVQRDHVHGDDQHGPEWVRGDEEHLVDRVE